MDIEVRPATKTEQMYCYTQSDQIMGQTGCIGHLRADMGDSGDQFFHDWTSHCERLLTPEFDDELNQVINHLREDGGFLKSRAAVSAYCYRQIDSAIDLSSQDFAFRADTKDYSYLLRLNPQKGMYTVYCYTKVSDTATATTKHTYSKAGKLLKTVDALGGETSYEYNANGFTTSTKDALGGTVTTEYGTNGEPLKRTDANGNETTYEYDKDTAQLVSVTDAEGNETRYTYNDRGLLIQTTDAEGNATTYEYALISSRSDGHGCPYCEDHKLLKGFNDFASQYPQLAKEWSEKNKVGADAVTSSKAGLFWWHCPSCGGEYSAWISSRMDGSRCPYCAGRVVEENLNSLSKTHPAIAAEWNCEKNGTITPDQVSALSKQEYWWKSSCGHEWKAKIYNRTVRKVPCPKCEQEFVYVLPQLLVMLYTGQNHLKVEFDTDDLTGIRMEMYIPELNLAIEERSTDERNHEQKVKRYICELQDVRYILYEPFKSAEDAAAFIRTILKEHHVHIKTAAADDIALCREKYNLLKRRKLR